MERFLRQQAQCLQRFGCFELRQVIQGYVDASRAPARHSAFARAFFFSSFFQYLVRMTLGMPICEGARDKRCKGGRGKRNLSALGFFSPNGFLSDFLCVWLSLRACVLY